MIDRLSLRSLVVLLAAAIALPLTAADPNTPLPPLPLGTMLLTAPSNHVAPEKTWELRFAHRFNGSLDDGSFSDQIHSLFGMDSGANVTMGIAYTPMRDLELSLNRSNVLDAIEVSAKYVVMQQAPAIPATLAVRGGADWRTESDLDDRSSLFAQAILSRRFGSRTELFATPTFVTNAGRVARDNGTGALFEHAFNVPVALVFAVRQNTMLVAEWTPLNRDLPDDFNGDDAWAFGIKQAIGGHHFEVMLSNTLSTTVAQSATTTYLGAPLRTGDLHIGFNIERKFGSSR